MTKDERRFRAVYDTRTQRHVSVPCAALRDSQRIIELLDPAVAWAGRVLEECDTKRLVWVLVAGEWVPDDSATLTASRGTKDERQA